MTSGRGDLSVCSLGPRGLDRGPGVFFIIGGVSPQGSPQGQTLRAFLP